jgi:hypothetical protein
VSDADLPGAYRRDMHRTVCRTLALSAVAVLIGCGGTTESAAPEPRLSGRVLQSNFDQSLASIRVQLSNDGPEPVHVRDVVLHSPPFPDVASDGDSEILPGRRIDFRFVYGQPTCSGATPTPAAATAEGLADGRPIEIAVDDSLDVLRRLLVLSCGRQTLAEVVTVGLGETWAPDPAGDAVLGTIELRRVGGTAEVAVQHMSGSVVFRLEPIEPAEPLAVLAADDDAISIPIRAKALRCDPHALAEGKKNYVFAVWLGLAGGPQEVKVEVKADVERQPTFDSLCAAGVGS